MTLISILAISALVSSIVLLQHSDRLFPIAAVIASGIEVAIALRIIRLSVTGLRLELILGAVLAIVGVIMFGKVRAKLHVGAATVVTYVGVLQVLLITSIGKG